MNQNYLTDDLGQFLYTFSDGEKNIWDVCCVWQQKANYTEQHRRISSSVHGLFKECIRLQFIEPMCNNCGYYLTTKGMKLLMNPHPICDYNMVYFLNALRSLGASKKQVVPETLEWLWASDVQSACAGNPHIRKEKEWFYHNIFNLFETAELCGYICSEVYSLTWTGLEQTRVYTLSWETSFIANSVCTT